MPPPAPLPARFPFWTEEKLRVADTDLNGHINNNAYGVYFEAARIELIHAVVGPPVPGRSLAMVIARLEVDFLREAHFPGRARIGCCVAQIGRSSVTIEHAVFVDNACVATGRSVLVMLDPATRQPSPISAELRAGFEALAPR